MKAIMLVGGEGTRLRPLTYDMPKQMLPVLGRPMLEHVLEHLSRHGIDHVVLSLGYLADAFLAAYPEGSAAGVGLSYAVEPSPFDTAGAVRFAADVAKVDETFVVLNADILTDIDLSALVALHLERGAEATIALHPVEDPSRFGVVTTEPDGKVTAFIEKPPRDEAPTNQINAGMYVLEPAALERIPLGRRVSIERETFPAMVRDGRLYAFADPAYWLDTGTPLAYLQAHRDLLEGRRTLPCPILEAATEVRPGLWTEGSVLVEGEVKGASFIGDGARVAVGAVVDSSVLGRGCVVEAGSVVSGSVLLEGARVAAGSVVSGSVLGAGATVGERCEVRPVSVLGSRTVVPSGSVLEDARVPE